MVMINDFATVMSDFIVEAITPFYQIKVDLNGSNI